MSVSLYLNILLIVNCILFYKDNKMVICDRIVKAQILLIFLIKPCHLCLGNMSNHSNSCSYRFLHTLIAGCFSLLKHFSFLNTLSGCSCVIKSKTFYFSFFLPAPLPSHIYTNSRSQLHRCTHTHTVWIERFKHCNYLIAMIIFLFKFIDS